MQLRPYQNDAVNSIFDYFQTKSGNPICAMPTGTGKSVVIGDFVKRSFQQWPNSRFLMLTHVKELITQNADKLKRLWETAPLGIYSAGLGEKNSCLPIIFGGVASVHGNVDIFGHRDLVLVDECHLISQNKSSMYQKVIAELKEVNPYLKVIGFSATPFRTGQGLITDDGLFTDICYNDTTMHRFNQLVLDGFIAPLIPKRTSLEYDVSQVKITNGDFNEHDLQKSVDIDEITYKAIRELLEYGYSRNSGLVFTSGIEHCEHVKTAIQSFGESATCVHSKMGKKQRIEALEGFGNGTYKYIVSNGVLTTGFDHPPIDIIGMLRPTMSVSLWVQMLGRGTRPYSWLVENIYKPGFNYVKENCLVLDFAGNTKRLGPINDPVLPRKKGQKTGDAPIRICGECGVYNHASARFCCQCGAIFEVKPNIFAYAGTEELIRTDLPIIETFTVEKVIYHKHIKNGSLPTMQASYFSGLRRFKEFIAFEHPGYAGRRALEWWNARSQEAPPKTIDEALSRISQLRAPVRIRVQTNKKFPEVMGYEY